MRISDWSSDVCSSDLPQGMWAESADGRVPVAEFLAGNDIVVNCVLQNTDMPLTFLDESDLAGFAPGSIIVDVSCDEGMGFSWARPTKTGSASCRERGFKYV